MLRAFGGIDEAHENEPRCFDSGIHDYGDKKSRVLEEGYSFNIYSIR